MKITRVMAIAALFCRVFVPAAQAQPFVYESPGEFFSTGDFNGDGNPDVLVVDKLTGNARVGYGNGTGSLTWSSPMTTGAQNPTGCGVGTFLFGSRDAVAVTSPTLNCVNLVDLSQTNAAGAPVIVTPQGIGPHTVAGLANPLGAGTPPSYNDIFTASSNNAASEELVDLMTDNAGAGTEYGQYAEIGPFDRGNALQVAGVTPTFAAGILRGLTNTPEGVSNITDALQIWQFASSPGVMLEFTNLASGSDYTFGTFNDDALHFIFYLPDSTNIAIATLFDSGGNFSFGNVLQTNVTEPIEGIFYLSLSGGGSGLIEFTNGVEAMSVSNGVIAFSSLYTNGAQAGNVFSGVVPLGAGQFALLDAPPGDLTSAHAQVVNYNGHTGAFTQLSSGNMPAITARNTRANIWLFQSDPFVNRYAGFVASLTSPDWTDMVTNLPSTVTVTTETDGGLTNGLGSPTTTSLGAPPGGSSNALVNQYNPAISLFSYGGPQPPQPVTVTISPPPGQYSGSVTLSFSTLNNSDQVYYQVGPSDSYHLYSSSFTITNDNTILYYGSNAAQPLRSQLQSAAYVVGNNNAITNLEGGLANGGSGGGSGSGGTNLTSPASFQPNSVVGTLFYGRKSAIGNGTVWAINMDGTSDTYITEGVRPRASRDGLYIAFERAASQAGQTNIWMRNLLTGIETLLLDNTNSSYIICYDWEPGDTGLIIDDGCGIWHLSINGALAPVVDTDCYNEAPVLNHQSGQIAFQDLSSNPLPGIFVAYPDGTFENLLASNINGASWPEWSPDGQLLSFADSNTLASLDSGVNLWVASPNGLSVNRICDFTGTGNNFPHGAIWSLDSMSLVGVGTIDSTNGIWIVPLNADRSDCGGLPALLPTTPGDALDFAGSIVLGNMGPVIVTQPQSATYQMGQSGGPSVTVAGAPPLHYEWIKDGTLLPGQTNSALNFASFVFTNSGMYQVVVTNPWGMALSMPVRMGLSNAPLRAWGDNTFGELTGYPNYPYYDYTSPFIFTSNAVAAAFGNRFEMWIDTEGNLWCQGINPAFYFFLQGPYYDQFGPLVVATNVVGVSAGYTFALYITADGTLWAWGDNSYGQLSNVGADAPVPVPVATGVVAATAGFYHSLYLTGDGTLWGMGDNQYGQVSSGDPAASIFTPIPVATNAVLMSAGAQHSLFVTADGKLLGMGNNEYGAIGPMSGYGYPVNNVNSYDVLAGNVLAVAAGPTNSIFLTSDTVLRGMGSDLNFQLGNPEYSEGLYLSYFEAISLATNVASIAEGAYDTYFLTPDGKMWAMGSDVDGLLGNDGSPYIGFPGEVPAPVNYGNFLAASLAQGSCAIEAGAVAASVEFFDVEPNANVVVSPGDYFFFYAEGCCGSFDLPQTYQWQLNGIDIPGATNYDYYVYSAQASDAGIYTFLVISPYYSSVGLSSATVTVLLPPSAPIITQQPLSASATFGQPVSLSVNATGAGVPAADPFSYEWIKDGVLLPSETNSSLSIPSLQLTNCGAYQIVVSNALGLAISRPAFVTLANEPLRGWGYDLYSQLGDGASNSAVDSPELLASNVVIAAGGAFHSLYVTADGTLWGMGYDYDNELGDLNFDIQYFPEAIATNVVAVAAGESHSLYVTGDGTLWSMGADGLGQLGYYGGYGSPAPVATNVVAVAAGIYHSLYLTADGNLWGMGNNQNGELGNQMDYSVFYPEVLATNVVTMAAGGDSTFYVTAGGNLWAMGDNSEGELGDGGTELNTNQPEMIATNVVAVASGGAQLPYIYVGGYHSMYVTADGNLWAMGYNGDGELGDGGSEMTVNLPEMITNGVTAISAGAAESYFVAGGSLWAAGDNDWGELGLGNSGGGGSTPALVNNGGLIVANLAKGAAALHALAVTGEAPQIELPIVEATNGVPLTFAVDIFAGDGPFSYQWQFDYADIPGATNSTLYIPDPIPAYSDAYLFSVEVSNAYGAAYAYGAYEIPVQPTIEYTFENPYNGQAAAGQQGYVYAAASSIQLTYQWLKDGAVLPGQTGNLLYFFSIGASNSGVYQMVASNSAGIAVSWPIFMCVSNVPLQAWGANTNGQLGNGTTSNSTVPGVVASNIVLAAAGANHSLYVTASNTLWAMGANSSGQLGDGTTTASDLPVNITSNVSAAAAGDGFSLFITTGGILLGMGSDASSQLGDDSTNSELLPEQLATNAVSVAAGQQHSLYLDGTGTLWAMGLNSSGQLGVRNTDNASEPVPVAGNVISVAAGGQHSLFLTADWNLWGMGLNSSGQLGLGTTNNALSPVLVATNVIAMAAGDSHSLYVTASNTLWAMGANAFGQLGNGSTNGATVPVMIASNAVAVSAGVNHSFYMTSDGRIWAMGQNASGQLGVGNLANSRVPVPVASGALVAGNLAKGPEASQALVLAVTGPGLTPPTILAVAVQTNSGGAGRIITLTVTPSQSYYVLVSTDLKTWSSLGSFSPNGLAQLIVIDTAATTTARFYKLEEP